MIDFGHEPTDVDKGVICVGDRGRLGHSEPFCPPTRKKFLDTATKTVATNNFQRRGLFENRFRSVPSIGPLPARTGKSSHTTELLPKVPSPKVP
jgi:hypothetical protein